MNRLGVVGTLVWDRIWRPESLRDGGQPVEDWGGISYSLSAVAASLAGEWQAVPIVRVGADLEVEARRFLSALDGLRVSDGITVVPEPNNRVELRYTSESARTEVLTGGVRPWSWSELAPKVCDLDALYVNFISGFEMRLEDAEALRASFTGPLYADLHSLFLTRHPDGRRERRSLPDWERWLRCFDGIQLNEAELGSLARGWADPFEFARQVLPEHVGLVVVTLGEGGAALLVDESLPQDPMSWHRAREPRNRARRFRSATLPPQTGPLPGDPTGCGDVWGGVFITSLLTGHAFQDSVLRANAAATTKMRDSGTAGLYERLRVALSSRI